MTSELPGGLRGSQWWLPAWRQEEDGAREVEARKIKKAAKAFKTARYRVKKVGMRLSLKSTPPVRQKAERRMADDGVKIVKIADRGIAGRDDRPFAFSHKVAKRKRDVGTTTGQ